MIENKGHTVSNDDSDDLEEMEFQPMLYIRKNDLPPNISPYNIILQLEQLYKRNGRYHCLEFPAFFLITFPTKAAAVRARNDGLDFEETHVTLYDAINHFTWLAHQQSNN